MTYTRSSTTTQKGSYIKIRERKNTTPITSTTLRNLVSTEEATYGTNPNWRLQVRLNQNATTSLDGEIYDRRTVISEADVFCRKTNKKASDPTGTYYDVYHFGLVSSYHTNITDNPVSVSTSLANNLAKAAFLKKLIKSQRTFQGGVFLGELREALRMLRRPARSLRESINSYHRTAKKRARKELTPKRKNRAVRETWLEYQYGWGPLMSDVKSGAEALARYGQKLRYPGQYLVSRGNVDSNLDEVLTTNLASSNGCKFRYNKLAWSGADVKYYGYSKSIPVNPITSAANIFGVMPREFLPTVWELIPYSFLVDYFTNIGDMIQGYAWQRAGLKWCSKTTRQRRHLRVTSHAATPATNYEIVAAFPSETHHESKLVTRIKDYTGVFVPDFTFEIPGFGSTKWLNIAALARLRR